MKHLDFGHTQVGESSSPSLLRQPRDSYDEELQRADAAALEISTSRGFTTVSTLDFPHQSKTTSERCLQHQQKNSFIHKREDFCVYIIKSPKQDKQNSVGDKLAAWMQEQNFT